MRSEIIRIIEQEKNRPGELLLDLERLHPDKSNDFWDEVYDLCCNGNGEFREVSLAVLTFVNRSLSNKDLDKLIDLITDKYEENAGILPYVMLMVRHNKRRDKLEFCQAINEWSEKVGNKHVRLNAQRCIDSFGKGKGTGSA